MTISERLSNTNLNIRRLHKEYVEENGCEPRFADVWLKFKGEDEEQALIKLTDYNPHNTADDPDDWQVTFFADGLNGLCEINEQRGEDFVITDIVGFSEE